MTLTLNARDMLTHFVYQLIHLCTANSSHTLGLSYDPGHFPELVVDIEVEGEAPIPWVRNRDRLFDLIGSHNMQRKELHEKT